MTVLERVMCRMQHMWKRREFHTKFWAGTQRKGISHKILVRNSKERL
jgi:hypothetical protein